MAVSTKTLTPTGQVVSIPDMTEKPNASVLSDGIGKCADAINALDGKIKPWTSLGTLTNKTDTVTVPSNAKEIMLLSDQQYVKASGVFPWSNGTTQYFGISNDTHITNAFINGNSISINAQRLRDGSAPSSINMTVYYR